MATATKPFKPTKKAVRAELARRAGDATIARPPQPLLRLWKNELQEIAAAPAKEIADVFRVVSSRRFEV